jgi:nucleoside-diphosphate-sugar epimerase
MFARLEQGRPILIPGDGFPFVHLIHIDDVARLMASVIGNQQAIGQVYNVAGRDFASVVGHVELMARAVGMEPRLVHVPLSVARAARAPLIHWSEVLSGGMVFDVSKSLRDIDWQAAFDLAAGYQDSYEWYRNGGRDGYEFDFTNDESILAQLENSQFQQSAG